MHDTAAPSPVDLKRPNGEMVRLHFRPLTDKDIDELDQWVRAEFLLSIRASFRNDPEITQEEKSLEIQVAQKHAATLSWLHGEGVRYMATPKGIAQVVWQHLTEKVVPIEELRTMMLDPENVEIVNNQIEASNNSEFSNDAIARADRGGSVEKKQRSKRLSKKQKKRRKRK